VAWGLGSRGGGVGKKENGGGGVDPQLDRVRQVVALWWSVTVYGCVDVSVGVVVMMMLLLLFVAAAVMVGGKWWAKW
jgi:hypothetical protein